MLLVTGAAGKTGRAVIEALVTAGEEIRSLVYRQGHVQIVAELGVQDVMVGDMRQRAIWDQAVQGVRGIYHICPNVSPYEVTIGKHAIEAARAARVEQFVYHSVLHPQTEAMPHHWNKLRVEEMLFESGLSYTILQPTIYMQNILANWSQIIEQSVYSVPYSTDTSLSMVDLADVAKVAAMVLSSSENTGATYELVGEPEISPIEVAKILSQQLDREVRVESMSLSEWTKQAHANGLGDYQIETLTLMFQYYDRFSFRGNPQVLTWLLNRQPSNLTSFIAAYLSSSIHDHKIN
jgi:uncharacterized protein YbjT (DUF2867 family)